MLKNEKNYAFQQRLVDFHPKNIRIDRKENDSEYRLPDTFTVANLFSTEVTDLALEDFFDYAKVSQKLSGKKIDKNSADIVITNDKNLGEYSAYMGYFLEVGDNGIKIRAFDERGAAQALYYLEFLMTENKSPIVKKDIYKRKAKFSPRMVHSAYYIDEFPDKYLQNIAHYGYDAILLFVTAPNKTHTCDMDFKEIIARAKKYGIDIYAFSYLKCFVHPDDEGAKEKCDEVFGSIFKEFDFKGVFLCGESAEFPSKDPHTNGKMHSDPSLNGIIGGKPCPGWYPCYDYPAWISMVRDSVHKFKPDAKVIFSTYNWGWVDKEQRKKFIDTFPKDVVLFLTYEIFGQYERLGVKEEATDYSIAPDEGGYYFKSEAQMAKERGIELFVMSNTAGRTWDFGVIPYEPMPYQWIKRYNELIYAHENYGLTGLMEGHHYGFFPSFIGRLTQFAFTDGEGDIETSLKRIIKTELSSEVETVENALRLFSEGIRYMPASIEEQYGPFRVGTAYPLCLIKILQCPADDNAHFGNGIWSASYGPFEDGLNLGYTQSKAEIYGFRHKAEIKMLTIMKQCNSDGIKMLKSVKDKTEQLERLINLMEFQNCCVETTINAKKFYEQKSKIKLCSDKKALASIIKNIEKIGNAELRNAKRSITFAKKDSSLGFEASMLYMTDQRHIEWKIKQVEYMLTTELDFYKKQLDR